MWFTLCTCESLKCVMGMELRKAALRRARGARERVRLVRARGVTEQRAPLRTRAEEAAGGN